MSKNPERIFSANYAPLGEKQLREVLRQVIIADKRGEINGSERRNIKEAWLRFYERFGQFKDTVLKADNERAFFDACADFFDITLPTRSWTKPPETEDTSDAQEGEDAEIEIDYEGARKLFIHWGRLADDVIDKCNKDYFCGESNASKLGMYNEVKDNIPLKLLSLTDDEDAKRAFQAMRKLFLIYTFGSISNYLSYPSEISLESVTEDALDQKMAHDLNILSQLICEKDETGRVKDTEKSMNIVYDPKCNGRVRTIEIFDKDGRVVEQMHYIYEDLGETEDTIYAVDRNLCIVRQESMTMRLVKTDDGESIPAFIESRPAKRILAYAFKVLRQGVPPEFIQDYEGWHAVTVTKEDARRILPELLQAAPQEFNTKVKDHLPKDKIIHDFEKGDIHIVNTKFHRVSWGTAHYGEGQVLDLVNYWNQYGVGREEHDFFRALQNVRLLPILYPERIYGMRFNLNQAIYDLFDIIYRRHKEKYASEYHARLAEGFNSDPENIKLLEEEFYRKFARSYRKEFIEQKFKPIFSADFHSSEAEPKKTLLNAGSEEAKDILSQCGVKDEKEMGKCLKNLAVIKENKQRLFTVLSKQAAELMAFVNRDEVGTARYNAIQNMLSEGAAREVSQSLIDILLKEHEFADEREENNNNHF